jgi:hypothetical protein
MASNFPGNYTIFDQFFRMAEPVPAALVPPLSPRREGLKVYRHKLAQIVYYNSTGTIIQSSGQRIRDKP